jgi:hypothetical protein
MTRGADSRTECPHREAASEIALTGVLNGTVINSIIDRSFVDEQGTRWIIDFKPVPTKVAVGKPSAQRRNAIAIRWIAMPD